MSESVDPAELLADLETTFSEVAQAALGLSELTVVERLDAPPAGAQGAYLGLVGMTGAMQIGLASDAAGCQRLSKGLMGMGDADPDLADPELADAFCEIVNIVAGGFKARIRERCGTMTLGLPVFFHGPAQPTDHTAVRIAMLRAGPTRLALLLVFPRVRRED